MPLPINPISKAAASLAQNLGSASNAFNSAVSSLNLPAGSNLAALSAKVNQLGGGIGSALNGVTGAIGSISNTTNAIGGAASALGGVASNLGSGITSAVSAVAGAGIGGSSLGNALSGISSIAGIAGAAGKAIGGIGSAIAGLSSSTASLGAVFGELSKAAGQLNNLLSLGRGKNLPAGGELFKTVGGQVAVSAVNAADWRVRLNCPIETIFPGNAILKPLISTQGVMWPYLPNVKLATRANYKAENPIHNNFPYQLYQNSQVEDITIDGEFSVQNESEGLYWIAATTFLRTATKMFYGSGSYAGNPPVICKLTGYGTFVFNNVPVVIKNFSVDFRDDVQYVQVNAGSSPTWVPAMSTISVTVSPIYNRQKLRQFSLQNFAKGAEIGMI
jgi:hypothetical protein